MNNITFDYKNTPGIRVEHLRAFDWLLSSVEMDQGASFNWQAEGGTRADCAYRTLWTKGLIKVRMPDGTEQVRTPGTWNLDLTDLPAGQIGYLAEQPSKWWCVNSLVNRNRVPDLQPIFYQAGQSVSIEKGTRLLVCRGCITVNGQTWLEGQSFSVVNDLITADVGADEPFYALKFL